MNASDLEGLAPKFGPFEDPTSTRDRSVRFRSRAALLLVVVVGFVSTGGIDMRVDAGSSSQSRGNRSAPRVPIDTDNDGIFDHIEVNGWTTKSGNIYHTDPTKFDSDGDGLSDGEEAGDLVVNDGFGSIYLGVSNPLLADTDADGLDDSEELALKLDPYDLDTDDDLVKDGTEHFQLGTNPLNPDSDGDGLPDGVEVGALVEGAMYQYVYSGFSNPLVADTDGDGLSDADEADLGINPYRRDSDGDGLDDLYEMEYAGTAPELADTDGDGFYDKYENENRESQGLDPLWADVKVSKSSYAVDFAKGAVLGDLGRVDSMAWLAGNLVSGGSSFIPAVGTVVGGLADIRDAVGSAIHSDWVGAGFSAVGVIPGGDFVAIPGKASKFVARNPHLAASAAELILSLKIVPDKIKVQAARQITPKWDLLLKNGGSEKGLIRLQKGRSNLNAIGSAMSRSVPFGGPSVPFMSWKGGESYLYQWFKFKNRNVNTQTYFSIAGCGTACTSETRVVDVLVDQVAHESKVGYASLSASTRNQINADAWLVKSGKIKEAHWHFFPSEQSNTVGASEATIDLLNEKGIKYTIHLPTVP